MANKDVLEEIKARHAATGDKNWEASGNYPFYVVMKKPRPSLSKHDSDRPEYWNYADGEFVLAARNHDVPWLIAEVEKLRKEIEELNGRQTS